MSFLVNKASDYQSSWFCIRKDHKVFIISMNLGTCSVLNSHASSEAVVYMTQYDDCVSLCCIQRNRMITKTKTLADYLRTWRSYTASLLLHISPSIILLLRMRSWRYTIITGESIGKLPPIWKGGFSNTFLSLLTSTDSENIFYKKKAETCPWNSRDFISSCSTCQVDVL
jgi:hypothetical protein